MGNAARATYVRYRTERAPPGNLWSSSARICCLSRQRRLTRLRLLGAVRMTMLIRHGRLAPASRYSKL